MADKDWLLAKEAEIAAINAEIQGMIAENSMRGTSGESPAYVEKDFQAMAQMLHSISNEIMMNR